MAGEDEQRAQDGNRRGLHVPSIRRGTAARWAIRVVRLARAAAWQALEVALALVILFEEWGWQPLSAALARLARLQPIARLEAAVVGLPPWPSLAVFLVPWLLFMPLKIASLWLIGHGQVIGATLLFAFAKVAGTALYARIFQLTQPSLMRLAWFARAYNWFMPWKEAIVAHARQTAAWRAIVELKARLKVAARAAWGRLKPFGLMLIVRARQLIGRGKR